MFLHLSVILFTGGVHTRGVWYGDMRGRGGVWQGAGHMWQKGMCGRGACVAGAHAWQGACVAGGVHGREAACVAGETATAADGILPTGMLSCYSYFSYRPFSLQIFINIKMC